jgi:hypothetical protein
MTLPATPFVCENIDVEAAARAIAVLDGCDGPGNTGVPCATCERRAEVAIVAALGEVIPAEVGYLESIPGVQRYTTKWQPVVSDKENP